MFTNERWSDIEGSPSLLSSVANAENITMGAVYVNFTFQADQVCHVFINGSTNPIYLRAGVAYQWDMISSLKIQEAAITFTWIGVRA